MVSGCIPDASLRQYSSDVHLFNITREPCRVCASVGGCVCDNVQQNVISQEMNNDNNYQIVMSFFFCI